MQPSCTPCFYHQQTVISTPQSSTAVQSRTKLISFQFCPSGFFKLVSSRAIKSHSSQGGINKIQYYHYQSLRVKKKKMGKKKDSLPHKSLLIIYKEN